MIVDKTMTKNNNNEDFEDKLEDLKASFEYFDEDSDGRISKDELRIALRGLGQYPTEQELDDMMSEVDKDGSGTIEFEEFVSMMKKRMTEIDEEEQLRKSFHVFDKDGDGTISVKELRFVLTQMGEKLSETEVQSMLNEADLDGDGVLNYEEFVKMMTAT